MKNWEKLEADENMIINKHFSEGRDGASIKYIVLHHNAGNLSIADCARTWQTREASAHYQVQSDGRIGQLVWDTNTAWHAGNWDANIHSIGIEHADDNSNPWHISDATLDNGAHLTAMLCKAYGLGRPEWGRNVFPHNHFTSTACPASIAGSQLGDYMARAQSYYDGTPVSSNPAPVSTPATSGKSVDQLANEVIAGLWSTGDDRRNRLQAAGYDFNAVQARVNQILLGGNSVSVQSKQNLDQVANDVINGAYGNGDDRRARLQAAGYDFNAVQTRVNQILQNGGGFSSANLDSVARDVINGAYGNGDDRRNRLQAAGYDFNAVQARVNQILAGR